MFHAINHPAMSVPIDGHPHIHILVGAIPIPLKNDFVTWDEMKFPTVSGLHVPNHQADMIPYGKLTSWKLSIFHR